MPNIGDESMEGVETFAKTYQMVLGSKAISGAGEVPALLNGGVVEAAHQRSAEDDMG